MKKESPAGKKATSRSAAELLADLRIHQVELEMQNEELRKAQEELEKSRAKYYDLYDFAPIGYLTFDQKGVITEANLTAAKLLGRERGLLLQKPFAVFVMPEDARLFYSHLKAAINDTGKTGHLNTHSIEIRLKQEGGGELYAQLHSVPADNPEGARCIRTILTDITSLKHTETILLESFENALRHEREISALLEASRAVLENREFKDAARSIFNSYKNLIGATAGYVALLKEGGKENEISFLDAGGLPCTVDSALPMPVRGLRANAYLTRKPVYHNDFSHSDYEKLLPEGHVKLESVIFIPLVIEEKAVGLIGLSNKPGGFTEEDARIGEAFGEFVAIALQNSKLMGSLERSEERYRSIYDQSPIGIILYDEEGALLSLNRAALDMFGISGFDEVKGIHLSAMSQLPAEIEEELGRGVAERFEMKYDFDRVQREKLFRTLKSGFIHLDVQITLLSRGNETGLPAYLVQIQDITSRRDAEQIVKKMFADLRSFNRRLEDEIEERKVLEDELKSKNYELGDFSSKVSHELKNNLLAMQRLMEISETKPEYVLMNSKLIAKNFKRLIGFVEKILQLAKTGRAISEKENIPLADLARRIFRNLMPEGVSGEIHIQEAFPSILGDPLGIEQVFSNLISNSFQHRDPKKKEVLVRLEYRPSGRTIQISMRDNGKGIEPHIVEQIFDPFFTTGVRANFGFGLAITRKIVEAHGGTIYARSEGTGKGTEFVITLPYEKG